MEETPDGTPVGVDDPYEHASPCDHLTGDGRCRYALDYAGQDTEFAADRRADDYECLVADEDADWPDCPHYRSTTDGKSCARCGLEEVRMAHDARRPLVEEHHLSYGSGRSPGNGGGAAAEEGSGGRGDRRSDGRPRPSSERDGWSRDRKTEDPGVASGSDTRDDGSDRDADGDDTPTHEITVGLCRWCHAKVHRGFARVDDDANPDPEAIAERESRRGTEMGEFGFSTARERRRNE
ncbi:DUF7097 family protein [Halorarum halophilum]|uniref:DUF7097 family protein n=1 Tax=Halorarum halophilum TaxID=2743090 RepID=UPI001FE61871|nr:hypothetical protein [Halobaculum halophilum]